MRITKKCGICGYEFTYDNDIYVDPLVLPFDEGARYYYDLWHDFVEVCPHCGYASFDVSNAIDKSIIKNEWFNSLKDMPIIKTLERARPNRIADYLSASIYYDSIGNRIDYAKCMLQASDLVYAEMMYWDEYMLDSNDSLSAIQNKFQYNEFKEFADGLFVKGVDALDDYVKDFTNDIDALILLAGVLNTGDKIQQIKGASIINKLNDMKLTPKQKLSVEFLESKL